MSVVPACAQFCSLPSRPYLNQKEWATGDMFISSDSPASVTDMRSPDSLVAKRRSSSSDTYRGRSVRSF